MKKKEKIIGSLVIAILASIFLFVGYSKSNDKNISEKEMEKLFLDNDENSQRDESKNYKDGSEHKENDLNEGDNKNDKTLKSNGDSDGKEIILEEGISSGENESEVSKKNSNKIMVEVKGEVRNPNVYVLEDGSRIFELIEMAGGPTENADLSNINRALYLSDGQCIVVNNINEKTLEKVNEENPVNMDNSRIVTSTKPKNNNEESKEDNGEVININSASKERLMTLNGIGESKAQAIIDYREENGGFKSVDDIMNISGIGEKTLEKIKDKISIK